MMMDSKTELPPEQEQKFDADLSPQHPKNREVAARRGLKYDERKRAYVDEDGTLRADRFGQYL
jgi:hypothetical protein